MGHRHRPILDALTALKWLAPTLFDKVCRPTFTRVLGMVPEAALCHPPVVARIVGAVIVTVGETVLIRDTKALADVLVPVARVVAGPGRATVLVQAMRRFGVALDPIDAERILAEFKANPEAVLLGIEQLRRAVPARL